MSLPRSGSGDRPPRPARRPFRAPGAESCLGVLRKTKAPQGFLALRRFRISGTVSQFVSRQPLFSTPRSLSPRPNESPRLVVTNEVLNLRTQRAAGTSSSWLRARWGLESPAPGHVLSSGGDLRRQQTQGGVVMNWKPYVVTIVGKISVDTDCRGNRRVRRRGRTDSVC